MSDNEGWIPHYGGEMPCNGKMEVDIKLQCGVVDARGTPASHWLWGRDSHALYDITFWRPHKNADGQDGQEVAAWTAAQGAPTVLSQEGVGQAVAEVYQVWRSKTHAVSWNAHAVDALPVGTKLYASPACSAPDDGALKEQAEAWQAVCVVLGEIEPDWA